MAAKKILEVKNVAKQYRLGVVGTGTLSHDLNRWWYKARGLPDPYLSISQENKREEEGGEYVWALRDISFDMNEGEVLGIIGKNGAGKSTLLKVLSRITHPTKGSIKYNGRIASLLEVGTGFHPELTGRENIFLNGAILGMNKQEIAAKLDDIVDFAGVAKYIDTPVKRYSSGMTVRLGFAVAAHLEPEILIVDEVLAVGDADFQQRCVAKMEDVSKQGRTILFVSHNMNSVNQLCNRGLLMNNGTIEMMHDDIQEVTSRYLQDSLDSARRNVADRTDREGLGFVKLMNIEVVDQNKEPMVMALSGKPMFFRLTLMNSHPETATNIDLRVVLKNWREETIGFLHSKTSGQQIDLLPGENDVLVGFERNPLSKGRFVLDVGIRRSNIVEDKIQKALDFESFEERYYGVDYSTPNWFNGVLLEQKWVIG